MLQQLFATTRAEARPYQERVITKSFGHFVDDEVNSLLINSPTGSGKTVMGMMTVRMMMEQFPDIGWGWCAMRRNLLTQAVESNEGLQLGVDGIVPISMFDKDPPTHDLHGRPIRGLVVDEAQHDAASSMCHLHNLLKPLWVLGLSATPFRTDKLKLCFQKVVKDAGIHQLIEQGYLSQFHHHTIPDWSPETVVTRYLADREQWGKSAMYWLNQVQADECLGRLQGAGVRAGIVLGTHPMSQREETLEAFDKGDLDVLVNLFVLTEGWDCPSLQTVWVRDSVRGPTIQMAGRVLRQHPDIPMKNIVQSKQTKWPMMRTATPKIASVFDEDAAEWRSVKASKKVENVHRRMIKVLASTQVTMPEYIQRKQERNFANRRRSL